MSEIDNQNKIWLKNKEICRFCLTQNKTNLSGIFDKQFHKFQKFRPCAPLPIQIMSSISIEVFANDGMPSMVCHNCRMIVDYCYRFKQMCKKSDTELRQFPLTGILPNTLEIPRLADEVIKSQIPKILNPGVRQSSPSNQFQSQPKSTAPSEIQKIATAPKTILNSLAATAKPVSTNIKPVSTNTKLLSTKPKILNKASIKILNKSLLNQEIEPIFSQPKTIIKDDGCMEIVTEVIEQNLPPEPQADPIKDAEQVETHVYPCQYCERSFPLKQLLDIHAINHTRERSFECEMCLKKFFSKYDLSKHHLIHTGVKPFECIVCKKSFSRSTLLYRHEKIHTDIPKFLCKYCEKPFLSIEELKKHTLRHEKQRPFKCGICKKSFAFKQGLERHETVHSKDQPFPCEYCNLSFPTPSKLSRHLTAHAGARPYPCKLCSKSYLLSHHLTRHVRSHREGAGNFKCYDCDAVFSNRDELVYHSAVHATQSLVCPLCKEQFNDLDVCTDHIKMHADGEQYACEFCDLIFMTASKLQAHSDFQHTEELAQYAAHTTNNLSNVDTEISNEIGEIMHEFVIEELEEGIEDILNEKNEIDIKVEKDLEENADPLILDCFNEIITQDNIVKSMSPKLKTILPKVKTLPPKLKTLPSTQLQISNVRGSIEIERNKKSLPKENIIVENNEPAKGQPKKLINMKRKINDLRSEIVETENIIQESLPKKSARIQRKQEGSESSVPSSSKNKVEMIIGDKKVQLKKLKLTAIKQKTNM